MTDRFFRPRAVALLIQLLAIVGAVGVMAAVPAFRMEMRPFSAEAARGVAVMAIDRGAALFGHRPLPGSFVAEGQRVALLHILVRQSVFLIAAPAMGCGR